MVRLHPLLALLARHFPTTVRDRICLPVVSLTIRAPFIHEETLAGFRRAGVREKGVWICYLCSASLCVACHR